MEWATTLMSLNLFGCQKFCKVRQQLEILRDTLEKRVSRGVDDFPCFWHSVLSS